MRRILEVTGILALLAWTLTGFIFWTSVKDRVVVQVGEAPEENEAVRLLADDVQTLREDLHGLTQALESNLGKLAEALAAGAEGHARSLERHVEAQLAALKKTIERPRPQTPDAGLLRRLESLRTEVAGLRRRLDDPRPVAHLEPPQKDLPEANPESLAPETKESQPPPAAKAVPEAPQKPPPEAPVQHEPAGGKAESRPARLRGFLSFSLPSESFRFDARQRFKILPDLSRVGFDASSTLHDFTGRTSDVTGSFILNPAALPDGCKGSINVRSAALDTGNASRDEEMRNLLQSRSHASIRFELSRFQDASADLKSSSSQGTARGTLTIGSVSKPFAMQLQISVDASRRLVLKGQQKLLLSSFGIEAPSQMGIVSMDDEVTVWIALRARAVGRAR